MSGVKKAVFSLVLLSILIGGQAELTPDEQRNIELFEARARNILMSENIDGLNETTLPKLKLTSEEFQRKLLSKSTNSSPRKIRKAFEETAQETYQDFRGFLLADDTETKEALDDLEKNDKIPFIVFYETKKLNSKQKRDMNNLKKGKTGVEFPGERAKTITMVKLYKESKTNGTL